MKASHWGIILAACVCGPIFPPRVLASDTLLVHGHIYTGNPRMPWAESIAISGTRIDAIGSDEALSRRLRAYAAAHPTDAVLFARADFSATPPSTPRKEILDRAVADRPVVIHNSSEHALWVNSAALRMAGITDWPAADAQEERGIVRDSSGHPSGVLLEAGMEVMERAVAGHVPLEDKLQMLEAATRYLNSFGITSVVNATGNLGEIRLFAALRDRAELTVRTRTAFGSVAVAQTLTPQFLSDLEEARTLYRDGWVSANLVKLFADGATGLIPPLVYEPHEYAALVLELDGRGFQIMTHADLTDDADIARFAA
jgi:predicted amidohydrolase YtcJ